MNDEIKLDKTFKNSLISDLANVSIMIGSNVLHIAVSVFQLLLAVCHEVPL